MCVYETVKMPKVAMINIYVGGKKKISDMQPCLFKCYLSIQEITALTVVFSGTGPHFVWKCA